MYSLGLCSILYLSTWTQKTIEIDSCLWEIICSCWDLDGTSVPSTWLLQPSASVCSTGWRGNRFQPVGRLVRVPEVVHLGGGALHDRQPLAARKSSARSRKFRRRRRHRSEGRKLEISPVIPRSFEGDGIAQRWRSCFPPSRPVFESSDSWKKSIPSFSLWEPAVLKLFGVSALGERVKKKKKRT